MEGGSNIQSKLQAEESKTQQSCPLRVLVLALDGATFFKLEENNKTQAQLVEDKQFPRFQGATIAKFTPYSGK